MNRQEIFGLRLRKARIKSGMKQRELGALIGVTGAMISELERGNKSPNFWGAYDMAKALGTTLDKLTRK